MQIYKALEEQTVTRRMVVCMTLLSTILKSTFLYSKNDTGSEGLIPVCKKEIQGRF